MCTLCTACYTCSFTHQLSTTTDLITSRKCKHMKTYLKKFNLQNMSSCIPTVDADNQTYGMVQNNHRPMLSRTSEYGVQIVSVLSTGKAVEGYCACCYAPSWCPLCSVCPCCADSEYIMLKREASKYFYVRENSIEWNEPEIVMKDGSCCGVDPCIYDIRDRVTILYYDDPIFNSLSDQTRMCNECRTCAFGGRGERLRVDSPCCCNLCQRSSGCLPFMPCCLPNSCCPTILRHEVYLEDAQNGLYTINAARKKAYHTSFYMKSCADNDTTTNTRGSGGDSASVKKSQIVDEKASV